jgi:hemoglobin-like flavoprotein
LSPHFGTELSLRVGIHFGPAIIGRIGHPARQQLTAIGDTVNVASRVESQNKELRTNLLITEECYAHVSDFVVIGDDFKTVLRGQSRPQRLYEVTGLAHPDPVFLIQRQMHRILLDGPNFVDRFYQRFFASASDLQALFAHTAMGRQHEMFLNQLLLAVRKLRNLPDLTRDLAALGERHRAYGVKPEHFPVAETALLGALEETLGEEFDGESRAAWTQTIQCLAIAMQGGRR